MAREILIRYQLRMRRVEISIEDPYCFSLVQVGGAKYTPSEAKAIRMSCTKAEALSNRKPFQPCNGGTTNGPMDRSGKERLQKHCVPAGTTPASALSLASTRWARL